MGLIRSTHSKAAATLSLSLSLTHTLFFPSHSPEKSECKGHAGLCCIKGWEGNSVDQWDSTIYGNILGTQRVQNLLCLSGEK